MIGRACDSCGNTEKFVYPVYKTTASMTIELHRNPVTGCVEGKPEIYQCVECNRKEKTE